MEYETNQSQSSLWQRLKDSPRTVSALIIILVIAAAIYAFSGPDQQPEAELAGGQDTEQEQPTPAPTMSVPPDEENIMTPSPVPRETLEAASESLPEAEQTGEGYVEKAEAGDGATHLARRAATRYLAERSASYNVTNEHRIYIEDYIQKKLGSPRLEIGESHTITFAMIEEAVNAAGQLTPGQLNNLSQYTYALQ